MLSTLGKKKWPVKKRSNPNLKELAQKPALFKIANEMLDIQEIWERILSRDPESIRKGFSVLNRTERRNVKIHLRKMVAETGWQPEQKISAQIALDVIKEQYDGSNHIR